PTSASWLNAVENFFSKMTRQRIRRRLPLGRRPAGRDQCLSRRRQYPAPSRLSGRNPQTTFSPNSTASLYHLFDPVGSLPREAFFRATACARRVTCSFCRILCMWFLTVAELIRSWRAISLLEEPCSASERISPSRD